jgi:hypothetical protein
MNNLKAKLQQEMDEDPELKKEVAIYQEDTFREYVKEKYFVENPNVLMNPAIMKMVFALEWYDIPRTAYSELIEFHPYLTVGDQDKLDQINRWHRTENSISWLLFSMIINRRLMTKSKAESVFKTRRLVRLPVALGLGGLITYAFNVFILRPIYLEELNQYGLAEKYFFLDLNADMMRQDLEQMGISIEAKHFDLEKTEQRIEQQ